MRKTRDKSEDPFQRSLTKDYRRRHEQWRNDKTKAEHERREFETPEPKIPILVHTRNVSTPSPESSLPDIVFVAAPMGYKIGPSRKLEIFDPKQGVETAKQVNDEIHKLYLAGEHAHRFRAFYSVAMQDLQAAAAEAERLVKELAFVGIHIKEY
ncbi:hypothetical protein N7454_001631 [Penicillium verhagenii]|nr:hypothetical protein N7454_001631 [Penicillium verhagenii]